MGELKNTFSWSFSAAQDFEECRRRRYWSKYGMWGGWNRDAAPEKKKAYQLNKMDNIYSLMGRAVEDAVMWCLREHQLGRTPSTEDAYQQVARPLLNGAWKESKQGKWKESPKNFCCLREHYYNAWTPEQEKERTQRAVEHTQTCIHNFIERVLPRLQSVQAKQEIPIGTIRQGDPESFQHDGIKIYAIPDYVYEQDGKWFIHDWKSGKAKDSHLKQVSIYGLWAHEKHGVPIDQVFLLIEYLASGQLAADDMTRERLDEINAFIAESVADMADYLEDGDIERNQPISREEWDLAVDRNACRNCNFYELCKPELEELSV